MKRLTKYVAVTVYVKVKSASAVNVARDVRDAVAGIYSVADIYVGKSRIVHDRPAGAEKVRPW